MSFFSLFRKTPPDADLCARNAASEQELAQARGDFRNQVQTIQSHSRRLQVMAGALALREGYDAQDDE
jgi:hypothetical protein